MIKRVLIVSLMGLSLAGCVNNDSLSGDVYTASEAKTSAECHIRHCR
ncbi:outer membrane lipoprotein [Citrobacter koseri]|uniref:Outer membrane lipoprotein n=1 Tax=Citrobacter koseri TaxID=545 RepID=A0A3S5DPD7_CITKO|nr:outer membrane lipoprotein [Citrobacter koseri]